MAFAVIAFFGSYAVDTHTSGVVRSVVWLAFVVAWAATIQRGNRARKGRIPRDRAQRRRDAIEWTGLFVVANAIVFGLGHVSWWLVGVSLAGLGAGSGWRASRRAARR
jgi:hypothetical protein